MIESFSVTNYRSIKHEQTISFVPNKKIRSNFDEHLLVQVSDSVQLLKFCVLYGYNASGKTNLLFALNTLRRLVIDGPRTHDEDTEFEPFALDGMSKQQPGIFQLIFYIEKIRYTYTVSLTRKKILSEELSFQPQGRKALLYSRLYDEDSHVSTLKYGTYCDLTAPEKAILKGNTVDNITTLFAYQQSNIHSKELEKVVAFFTYVLKPIIQPKHNLRQWSKDQLFDNPDAKQFHLDLLQKADFQISDVMLTTSKEQGIPDSRIKHLPERLHGETKDIVFTHSTSEGMHTLPYDAESEGTLRYIELSEIIHSLITEGGVATIDELESSLHPELVSFLLRVFLLNASDAQIIAVTHSLQIMNLDYIRNDMVWLCERDTSGASEYFSVQDFGLHKNINIANAYRAGRFGALPCLGSPLIEG